ncbi:hypothetical protein MSAN_01737500 [Mycena sanguinolenta]|uniref:Uncharacterized protein n=1 Tax=Mycena sanguinolenta TaxID=230812 RepID=A0A8H6XYI8_9AGAR|nr:hypothetical protein MSAN_01737500 [Mycena sanguinolenta]
MTPQYSIRRHTGRAASCQPWSERGRNSRFMAAITVSSLCAPESSIYVEDAAAHLVSCRRFTSLSRIVPPVPSRHASLHSRLIRKCTRSPYTVGRKPTPGHYDLRILLLSLCSLCRAEINFQISVPLPKVGSPLVLLLLVVHPPLPLLVTPALSQSVRSLAGYKYARRATALGLARAAAPACSRTDSLAYSTRHVHFQQLLVSTTMPASVR